MSTSEMISEFEDEAKKEGDLVAVESKIKNASSAFAIHEQFIRQNKERDRRRAKVVRHNAGNPPIPFSELKRRGESWHPNMPTREHETKIDDMVSDFTGLDDRVPHIPRCVCSYTDDAGENLDLGKMIAEKYHDLLDSEDGENGWSGFKDENESGIQEMMNFAFLARFWNTPGGFKWVALQSNQLLLPEHAKSSQDEWDMCSVRSSYGVSELWAMVSTPEAREASKAAGWVVEGIQLALMNCDKTRKTKDPAQIGEWTEYEKKVSGNSAYYDLISSKPVRVGHLFTKEMDGMWSWKIVFEDMVLKNEKQESVYLYDKKTDHEDIRHFVDVTYYGVKTFFHDHRGIGEKIYNQTMHIDILTNDALASTRLAQSQFLSGRQGDKDKIKFGRFINIGDMKVEQNKMGDAAGNAVAMTRFINQKMNAKIPLADPVGDRESVQPISAQETAVQTLKRGSTKQTHVHRYYRGYSRMLKEMWRRITVPDVQYRRTMDGYRERKWLLEKIDEAGIPREALNPEVCEVSAYRATGNGSPSADDISTREIVGYVPFMADQAKVNKALHNRVAAVSDYRTAQEYFPINEALLPDSTEDVLITLMLNDLREGSTVAVERKNRHYKHSIAIIAMLDEEIQRNAQDPVRLTTIMTPSMTKLSVHMDWMSKNPSYAQQLPEVEDAFNRLLDIFNQVRQQADRLIQEGQKQAAAQRAALEEALANKPDPDVVEALADAKVKELEVQLDHQAKMQKVANTHAEKLLKVRLDAQRDRERNLQEATNAAVPIQRNVNIQS